MVCGEVHAAVLSAWLRTPADFGGDCVGEVEGARRPPGQGTEREGQGLETGEHHGGEPVTACYLTSHLQFVAWKGDDRWAPMCLFSFCYIPRQQKQIMSTAT